MPKANLNYEEMLAKMGVSLICLNVKGQLQGANEAAHAFFQFTGDELDAQWQSLLGRAVYFAEGQVISNDLSSLSLIESLQKEEKPILGFDLPGNQKRCWMQLNAVPTEASDEAESTRYLVSMTEMTMAVEAKQQAFYQQALQALLLRITQTYISIPIQELDSTINQSLQELGAFIGADRIYVFEYLHDKEVCNNTYEWCAEGIESQIEFNQGTPYASFPDWLEAHLKGRTMLVQDVSQLDKESGLYHILEVQGIQSIIAVPMMDGDLCIGFVGIDAVRGLHLFTDAEQQLLQIFSQALVNVEKRFLNEQAVNASEKQYRQMAENLKDVLWTSDIGFNLQYCSPSAKDLLRLSPDAIARDLLFTAIELEQGGLLTDKLEELTKDASKGIYREFESDALLTRTGGDRIWIHCRIKPNYSHEGNFEGFIGVLRDINERKFADLELQANEEQLRKLLATQTNYVIRTDLQGYHTYWNQKFETDFGWLYNNKGLLGTNSLASVCAYDQEKAAMAARDALMHPGKIIQVELDKPAKDGSVMTTLWEFVGLQDSAGQPIGVQCMGIDITQRRKAELELQQNAEFLTKLLATQTNYVIRTNLEGQHTYWNSKFEEDFGWMYASKGLELSDTLTSICAYDREKAAKTALLCLQNPGKIYQVELDKPSKNGGTLSTLWEFIALADANGNPIGVQCMGIDITQRKQAELELKKREEQYRVLIESSDAAISMIDPEGTYMFVNSIAAAPFQQTPEDMVGMRVDDLFNAEDAAAILNDIKEVVATKQGKIVEPFMDIHGKKRWFRTSIQPILDEDDKAYAVFLHSTDITQTKEAEVMLRSSELKYKTLFNDSPEAYVMLKEGVFIDCNNAALELIGARNRNELIGRKPADISPDFQPNGVRSEELVFDNLRSASQKEALMFEWAHNRIDGETILVQVKLSKITLDGEEAFFISWLDITERKRAEENIRRFSQVIEQSPISVVITDLNGSMMYMNAFTSTKLGIDQNAVVNRSATDLYLEGEFRAQFSHIMEHLQNGQDWKGVLHNQKVNGEWMKEYTTIFPVVNKKGEAQNYVFLFEDITERLAMQEALKMSEVRSEAIAMHSRTAIWEVDANGLFTYVSPVSSLVYGRQPEEVVNKLHYYDIHPLEGREEFIALFEEAKQTAASYLDLENPIELPDGSIQWVSTNGAPVFNAQGEVVGFRGSDKDISAKKEARDELKKFRSIADQANYGTAIANLDGVLEYVNEAYAQMHGYNMEELIGTSVMALHRQTGEEGADEWWTQLLKQDGFAAKEVVGLRKDGSSFSALLSSALVAAESGGNRFLSFTIIDITERKNIEQKITELNVTLEQRIAERTKALSESNEELVSEIKQRRLFEEQLQAKSKELETFFDVALDLLCIADLNGNFIKLNKSWEEMLGYPRQQLENSKFLEFVHPEDVEATLSNLSRLEANEKVMSFTNRYRRINGEYRFIEWHSVPVGKYIYAAARDITDRIAQAEALDHARKVADEANHSKSEFLSRMSHELRTPLNSILGFAQLLAMGHLAESQQKGVNHILSSGRHLLDLINEVLDISRIEAGRISVSLEPVKVKNVTRDTVDLLSPLAQSKQVRLHWLPIEDASLQVMADKQRLKQVLTNLVNNAIKYNKPGGQVWLSVEVGQSDLTFVVKDAGIGISADDLKKVFDPFERLGAVNGDVEGTGLGLTVVKQLLDLMGGRVEVESEPGVGSTFRVSLPRVLQAQSHIELEIAMLENLPMDEQLHKGAMLYVEDTSSNVDLVEQILTFSPDEIELLHTPYGTQAVSMAADKQPALILLDLNLPDIHGRDVIKQLKADVRTKHIPVIVVSADAMSSQINELMELGAVGYLTKPLHVQQFLDEIHKYLLK